MQTKNIPEAEQEDMLVSFWQMLQECETKAEKENNQVLKSWVDDWYVQWNRVTKDNKKSMWTKL